MKRYALLTASGQDRVGIVDDLTTVILEARCNIEESRMALLGGEFAVILLLSGDEAGVRRLLAEMPGRAEALGLHASLRETEPTPPDPAARPYRLETTSLDTPGIVHSVTALLRRHGVNILDLETDTSAAPWTGAPLFSMRARLGVPGSVSITRLREELDDLEMGTSLDIRLTPER